MDEERAGEAAVPADPGPTTSLTDGDSPAAPGGEPPPLARGAVVGRYVVLDKVGAGGMGVVYAAYDPELDRKVALKLLHPGGAGGGSGRDRLLREAQALARLSHPNVLTVFDAGAVGDEVFLATELVAGTTLGEWLGAADRRLPEVLRLFLEAGRGLAAAHAAGLVHRDFKPGNVMVGDDGRVRVVDFGLARPAAPLAAGDGPVVEIDQLEGGVAAGPPTPLEAAITREGAVVGTPAYMAPEQVAGRPAGPAADQFAFSAALYEALYGELPFAPATGQPDWTVRPPPAGSQVPPRLRRALLRGLSVEPEDRFGDLAALLAELARDPWRRRRRWLAAAAVVLAVTAAALGFRRLAERRQEVCRGAGARLAAVWNPARRAALGRTFLTAGLADGAGLWGATELGLGRYLDGWVAAYTDACEATHFRGDQSAELLDLRMACLERRRQEVEALVDLLANGETDRLERAPEAVAALTPLVRCADAQALLAPVPPPAAADVRSKVAALRPRLARAKALEDLGQYAAGIDLARKLADGAESLGYWPLTAEALLRLGILEERDGRPQAAEVLGQAAEAATAGGDARAAAEAFTHLVRVYAYVKADHDRARHYAELATAALARLSEPGELEAELADYRGRLAYQQADYEGALEQHLKALALKRRILGGEHPEVAASLLRIATVRGELGALDEARADARRAVEIYRRALGPSHPRLVVALLNLGNFQYRDNDLQAALATDRQALALALRALGPGHQPVANARYQLGLVDLDLGRADEALEQFHQSLDVFTAELGPEHPQVAVLLSAIASAEERRGNRRAALGLYHRALAIQEKVYGPDHPWVATTLYNLGVMVKELGEERAAEGYFRRCLEIWEASYGAHHYLVAHALTGLGQALIGEGRPAAALAPLERALAMGDVYASDESQLGDVEFALARALMESGGDRERARSLAVAASRRFRRAGQDRAEYLAKVEEWLTAHPRGDPK